MFVHCIVKMCVRACVCGGGGGLGVVTFYLTFYLTLLNMEITVDGISFLFGAEA